MTESNQSAIHDTNTILKGAMISCCCSFPPCSSAYKWNDTIWGFKLTRGIGDSNGNDGDDGDGNGGNARDGRANS